MGRQEEELAHKNAERGRVELDLKELRSLGWNVEKELVVIDGTGLGPIPGYRATKPPVPAAEFKATTPRGLLNAIRAAEGQ